MTMSNLVLRIMISFHHFSGVILVLGKGKICPVPYFAIYQNNLEQFFVENDVNDLENIRNMCSENLNIFVKLFSLLYADDTIILSETEADMQYALAIFEKYCHHWKLKVNL